MPETLYLIDGHAQIFRAFYAIRGGMRSPVTGEPTHAIFGFAGMLFKLLTQLQPEYVVVAMDAEGPTFRDELFGDYKGTRDAMPEELAVQIPRIVELTELFGIPTLKKPGLEADDVIATLVQRFLNDPASPDLQIRIVSRDKDLEQLLGDRVSLYDIHTEANVDPETLLANKGIRPDQVIDYLTLTGDSVDNVPGVEGIGPKTAAQLLQEYGSLDGIYANLDRLKGKRKENLEKAREQIPLTRTLVTLKYDDALPFELETARLRPLALDGLIPLFQQLGFNRYQDDARRLAGRSAAAHGITASVTIETTVSDSSTSTPADASQNWGVGGAGSETLNPATPEDLNTCGATYEAITTAAQLATLVETLRRQEMISVDTETTGLGAEAKLCGICFAWEPGHGVYVPVRSPEPSQHLDEATVVAALKPLLEDETLPKCGHNLKFDARQLLKCGVRLRGVAFDTMLAATLLDPNEPNKLDHLVLKLLNYRMIPISALIGEGKEQGSIEAVPLEQVVAYAAEDADLTLRLYRHLLPQIEAFNLARLLREVEAPLSTVLAEMETNGILCDPLELKRQGEDLGVRAQDLRARIQELAGCEFHVDSPRQLEEVLFDRLGFASSKKTKTGRSTDVTVLEKLAAQEDRNDPRTSIPRLIIEYRQLTKLISTYLGNLAESVSPHTGRIHSTFHQLMTATGRLASHGPNLQNIPVRTDVGRQIRKAFHAAEGHTLICADYSQIELRILAHLSADPALLQAFALDQDIHAAVAAQVYGVPLEAVTREQRSHAKTINFGIIYGVTPVGLARRIEGLTVQSAARLIDDYRTQFPGIEGFLRQCVHQALEHGYVTTILGRRRAIPEILSSNRAHQSLGERLAINTVVQGSAADLIKVAMVNVQRRIDRDRLPLKLLLQIHDELVFEAPEAESAAHAETIRQEMERAMTLSVPLRAEAGIARDWMTAK